MDKSVIELIIGCILAVMGFLLKDKISKMDEKIEALEGRNTGIRAEMLEFKDNYLDRFEKINKNINDSTLHILNEFHKTELKLIEKINEKNK